MISFSLFSCSVYSSQVSDLYPVMLMDELMDGPMPAIYRALDGLMQMVVSQPGAVPRTGAEVEALVREAGLRVAGTTWMPSGHMVVEAE